MWFLVLGGILGARLYYVAFEWDYYRAQPWSIPAFWEGGLAIHGGLLGGLLAGVWLARRHRIPLWRLGDTIAGALRVSYGPIFSGGWKQENVEYRDMPVRFCHGFRPPNRSRKKHVMHPPHFDLHTERSRISGVDLTRIDGIEVLTAQTLMSEIGLDMSRWNTETHFASWLGLCPDNRISGGNVRTRGTRNVVNRAADALRLSAQNRLHSKSALGANYRRLRARLGAPKAITAMAHKLARLDYRMLTCGQHYVDKGMEHYEARFRHQRLQWLQRQAREFICNSFRLNRLLQQFLERCGVDYRTPA